MAWKQGVRVAVWTVACVAGLGAAGPAAAHAPTDPPRSPATPESYVAQWRDEAVRQMQLHGIPASITLAQGILESGSGGSALARQANNHFGIKCHSDWTGERVYFDDDAPGECFRAYRDASESFADHSAFLKKQRYAGLFALERTDYRGWAHGLKAAGYATDPAYADRLIGLIERYSLHVHDGAEAVAKAVPPAPPPAAGRKVWWTGNKVRFVEARTGDTYGSLARELDLMPWQLYRYNGVPRGEADYAPVAGERVYLEPFRRRGDAAVHTVVAGEDVRDVARAHAVQVSRIERLNRLVPGAALQPGDRLVLQWRLFGGEN